MGLKKGTKLTDNPRNNRVEVRLTKKESEDLQYCADALNTNKTDVIVKGIELVKEQIKKK